MREPPHWLARLRRIKAACVAGRALAPEDGKALVGAIDGAFAGRSFEEGLDLSPGWRDYAAAEARDAALAVLAREGESVRSIATMLRTDLARYRASGFGEDSRAPYPPAGRRGALYQLLMALRGEVPSVATLRRWLTH